METSRNLLVAFALSMVVLLLYQKFFMPTPAQTGPARPPAVTTTDSGPSSSPSPDTLTGTSETPPALTASGPQRLEVAWTLNTRYWTGGVDAQGNWIRFTLHAYRDRSGDPLSLVPSTQPLFYWAFPDTQIWQPVEAYPPTLSVEQPLTLRFRHPRDTARALSYTLTPEAYGFDLTVRTSVPLRWVFPGGIRPSEPNLKDEARYLRLVYSDGKRRHTVKLKQLKKGWAKALDDVPWWALRTKFFALSVAADHPTWKRLEARVADDSLQTHLEVLLPPGTHQFRVFLGPLDPRVLARAGGELPSLFDYGNRLIAPFSRLILWAFSELHRFVPNWGWVIVLFALGMKLVFWPLTFRGMLAMRKMQEIQPKVEALRKLYKDDPERLNREVLALYQKHRVNPFSGCLPLLIQLPVFYGLYRVLQGWIELRGAPFTLWIHDLSTPDPYYLLPVLMGAVSMLNTLIQSKNNPQSRNIGIFMAVFFTFLFARFPAGIVLYWLVYNVFSVVEQLLIQRTLRMQKEGG